MERFRMFEAFHEVMIQLRDIPIVGNHFSCFVNLVGKSVAKPFEKLRSDDEWLFVEQKTCQFFCLVFVNRPCVFNCLMHLFICYINQIECFEKAQVSHQEISSADSWLAA